MENLYFGIITISICFIGYFIAYKQYSNNHIITALILLMFCGLLLRFYTASDLFIHTWDERYHALVAKNIIGNPFHPTLYENPIMPFDYRNWTGNHIWVHKQPLPLWIMAISLSVFGNNEIAIRLPSILLSTLGIGITFYIAKFLFNNRVGIIAAFLFSIHGLIIEITAGRVPSDHVDVFFLFFIQLSVLLAIKYFQSKKPIYNVFCGVSIGLAILSKWLPALIVLPIWLLLAIDSKNFSFKKSILHFLLLCCIVLSISIPWQLYIFSEFPKEALWESSYNIKHITGDLEDHGRPFYYHFDKARMLYSELIYLPLIWLLYKSVKHLKNYRRLILSIWIFIPFIFFSIAETKMQAYTLFTAPAIFIATALFWEYLFVYRKRFKYKGLIVIILFLLIALPIRYSIERTKPFTIRERNPKWAKELKELSKLISDKENVVIFNCEHPIETMFYANCIAYTDIPDSLTLSNIEQKGYTVYIRKDFGNEFKNSIQHESDILLTDYNTQYKKWSVK